MTAAAPGDWVECIDPNVPTGCPAYLTRGALYCIEAIAEGLCVITHEWETGFVLVGVGLLAGSKTVWAPERFRPIYRPNADIIDQLKRRAGARLRPLLI